MTASKRLGVGFYDRRNVVTIARELLGKILVTQFDGIRVSGRIVETEAYAGVGDRASHAFGGRRTARTEIMFQSPGSAYVYLCYGIHHLFNVVTNKAAVPHAILIRALEPIQGIDLMLARTGKAALDNTLTRGPGNVSKALGLATAHSGESLLGNNVWIEDDGQRYRKDEIAITKRIGVEYALADAELPYRFLVKGNQYVSGKKS